MIGRHVQGIEIVKVILDMRTFGHAEAEIAENLQHFFPDLRNGMDGALRLRAHRQCHIQFFGRQTGFQCRLGQQGFARSQGFRHLVFEHIECCTRRLAFLRGHFAEARHTL